MRVGWFDPGLRRASGPASGGSTARASVAHGLGHIELFVVVADANRRNLLLRKHRRVAVDVSLNGAEDGCDLSLKSAVDAIQIARLLLAINIQERSYRRQSGTIAGLSRKDDRRAVHQHL